MKIDVKDVSFCPRRGMGHQVPRNEMTKMLADDGKTWIRICVGCKDEVMDRRAKAKKVCFKQLLHKRTQKSPEF